MDPRKETVRQHREAELFHDREQGHFLELVGWYSEMLFSKRDGYLTESELKQNLFIYTSRIYITLSDCQYR